MQSGKEKESGRPWIRKYRKAAGFMISASEMGQLYLSTRKAIGLNSTKVDQLGPETNLLSGPFNSQGLPPQPVPSSEGAGLRGFFYAIHVDPGNLK